MKNLPSASISEVIDIENLIEADTSDPCDGVILEALAKINTCYGWTQMGEVANDVLSTMLYCEIENESPLDVYNWALCSMVQERTMSILAGFFGIQLVELQCLFEEYFEDPESNGVREINAQFKPIEDSIGIGEVRAGEYYRSEIERLEDEVEELKKKVKLLEAGKSA